MKHISILDILYSLWQRKNIILLTTLTFFILSLLYILITKPVYNPTAIVKANVFEISPIWATEITQRNIVPSTPVDKVGTQIEIIKIITPEVLKEKGINIEFKIPKNYIFVESKKTLIDTIKKNIKFDLIVKNDSIFVLKDKNYVCNGVFQEEINCNFFSFKLKKLKNFNKEIKGKIVYKNFPKTIDNWMKDKVVIDQEGLTDLIKITILDEDPKIGSDIANSIANKYLDFLLEQERRIAKLSKIQLEELLKKFDYTLDTIKNLANRIRLDSLTLVSYLLGFRTTDEPLDEALARIVERLILNPNDNYLRNVIIRFYNKDIEYDNLNKAIISLISRRDTIYRSILDREIVIAKTVSPAYIVSYAGIPYKPIWPNKLVLIFLSIFSGFIIGIIISIIYDIFDKNIITIFQLKRATYIENVNFFYSLNELKIYLNSKKHKKFYFNEVINNFKNFSKDEADEYVLIIRKPINIYSYLEILNEFSNKPCNIVLL